MHNQFDEQLHELRQQLPIGVRYALQLLARTEGDVPAAAQLFKQAMVDLAISKTSVPREVAAQHLQEANYDINASLKSIHASRFTLTERILLQYKNNSWEGLTRILLAIEETAPLLRAFWLNVEELQKLPKHQYCLALVCEWLHYEEWEDLHCALYYHLNLVAAQLSQELQQRELAVCLLAMLTRHAELRQLHHDKPLDLVSGILRRDELLNEYEEKFKALKPVLISRLHSYIQQHITSFP